LVTASVANSVEVTAPVAIAAVSTASSASSLAVTALVAICVELIPPEAIFAPGIEPSARFNFP